MIFETKIGNVVIRSALPKDVPAFAAQFRAMFQFPTDSRLFVVEDCFGKLLGGGYLHFVRQHTPDTEPDTFFDLHVFDLDRFAEIGGLLLDLFKKLCLTRGRTVLLPIRTATQNSALGDLLIRHGFEPTRTFNSYIVETAKLLTDFDPTYRRLSERRRIPSETIIIPLREAPFVPTRELIHWTIGSNPLALEQQLGNRTFCEETSKVVKIGSRIIAVLLARVHDDLAEIVYLAVEPGQRNGWAYVALCTAFLRDISARGCPKVRLSTFNPSVMHSAERAGGEVVQTEKNFRLNLR